MSEYRLNIVCRESSGRGVIEEKMERLLDAFFEAHPEVGAVVASNFHLGTMDATFSVLARDAKAAGVLGAEVFDEVLATSDLQPAEITGINVERVDVEKELLDKELLAA